MLIALNTPPPQSILDLHNSHTYGHSLLYLRQLQGILSPRPSHLQPTSQNHAPSQRHRVKMDCFADYCLSCDRQTNGTPFCSQACRLAELDHCSPHEPLSPSYTDTEAAVQRATTPARSGFYLPPAFDFSLHRSRFLPPIQHTPPSSTANRASQPITHGRPSLSPSSSQTSLSSIKTNQSYYTKLSEQAENDLKDYARSFDQVRTLRRRISLL